MLNRIIRQAAVARIRQSIQRSDLETVIKHALVQDSAAKKDLLQVLQCVPDSFHAKEAKKEDEMEISKPDGVEKPAPTKAVAGTPEWVLTPSNTPEVTVFLQWLTLIMLVDAQKLQEAMVLSSSVVSSLLEVNRRTMDDLRSRIFFYHARIYELLNKSKVIRPQMLAAYRSSVLHHDYIGQAMLLNLLLRGCVNANLFDQADKLISKTQFPEIRSNNQFARYLYYMGRIHAVQLDYTESLRCLTEALRKAPQTCAFGFRTQVQKMIIIVQLLTGEIPDRDVFRQPKMGAILAPYLALSKAVRDGDLDEFRNVVEASEGSFVKDGVMNLITRLRQNVIKAGLRRINLCYSRISIADICARLKLESPEDAELIIAKAVRDGVIDAVIDHEGKFISSKESLDTYSSIEPTNAFHNRISFCLNIHNEAVCAMRFPDHQDDDETAEARRERLKEEQELALTLVDDDDEEDDDGF